jgi:hypothetical protein
MQGNVGQHPPGECPQTVVFERHSRFERTEERMISSRKKHPAAGDTAPDESRAAGPAAGDLAAAIERAHRKADELLGYAA